MKTILLESNFKIAVPNNVSVFVFHLDFLITNDTL